MALICVWGATLLLWLRAAIIFNSSSSCSVLVLSTAVRALVVERRCCNVGAELESLLWSLWGGLSATPSPFMAKLLIESMLFFSFEAIFLSKLFKKYKKYVRVEEFYVLTVVDYLGRRRSTSRLLLRLLLPR